MKLLSKVFVVISLLLYSMAFALPTERIDRDLEQELDSVLEDTLDIKIPDIGTAQYGALENNLTRLSVQKFSVIYSAPPPAEIKSLVDKFFEKYSDENLTIKQVVAISRALEQQFVQAGYPLVRSIIPAQKFKAKGADIKVNIVSGYIEDIRLDFGTNDSITDTTKSRITTFINNAWGALKQQKYLQQDEINESLLTLRSHYGITPALFVSTGQKLGGFVLNVSVAYQPSVHFASVKNNLGPAFGGYSGQYVGMFNKIKQKRTERYRIISIFSLSQKDDEYYRMVKLDYSGKLINGNTFGGYMTATRTASINNKNKVGGISAGYGVEFTKPLITKFKESASVNLALDSSEDASINRTSKSYFYKDRITMLSASLMYNVTRGLTSHDVAVTVRRHVPIFRSRITKQDSINASKSQVDDRHSILELAYTYKKPYPYFRHHVTINAQGTDKKSLLSTHRFSFMGADKVAGFVGDGMSADSGLSVNTGFTFKTVMLENRAFAPILDFALAEGRVYNATSVENARPRANSVKLGFSTNFVNAKWEFGFSHARKQTQKNWQTDKHYSINVLRLF